MQRFFVQVFSAFLILIAGVFHASATHIIGADFYYTNINLNPSRVDSYRVTLVIYGDCKGSAFPNLQGSTPIVELENNGALYQSVMLTQQGLGVEVTPVCPAEQNNTTCKNPSNPIPGVTRYIYSTICRLPSRSANWVFRFDGSLSSNSQAGRSGSITNIASSGSSIMALEARLDNLNSNNSSPQFTTIPTPFYCANIAQQYNLGATDVNNDSLTFALVPGLVAGAGGTVSYIPPFSATNPLSVSAGTFSFSSATGQMNFTPNSVQISLVVEQVNEYRNGRLVGTAMREMNFVVLSNCNNTPAASAIDTAKSNPQVLGGVIASLNDFNVCQGIDSAHFNIIAINPAHDTIAVSVAGLPNGATASVDSTNKTQPIVTVSWKRPSATPGSYTFYVTYKDNGCPLTSTQTTAYTIHVYAPNTMSTSIAAPTQCVHQALVDYHFAGGLAPRTISVSQGGNVIHTFRDSTGHVLDSLGTGTYQITINSDNLVCPSYYNLTIVDSGVYPNPPAPVTAYFCKYDPTSQLIVKADSGAMVRWYAGNGAFIGTVAPFPRTDTTGIFTWYVDQIYKVCVSKKDSIKAYVTLRPIASFTGPHKICLNDTADFMFTGMVGVGPILDYVWDFAHAGYTSGDSAGPWRVHWYDTGTKVVTLRVDENKCSSYPFADTLLVKPVPYAGFSVFDVCQFDTVSVYYNTVPYPGQTYAWNFSGADVPKATGPGPYILRWVDSGAKQLSLTVGLDGCTDTRSRTLTVHPVPGARILNGFSPVCIGDKITLLGTEGMSAYYWVSSDSSLNSSALPFYTFQVLRPQTINLQVQNQWGCRDTTGFTYSTVQPCCNFSYPNAFTPNGDQHNDRFHVITYGNQVAFELSIFNRWGQRVYHGTDALQGWDGTYNGKACDAGTYFYYLDAKCYTGHQETHKGEVELIR